MIPIVIRTQGTFFADVDLAKCETRLELQENFIWDALKELSSKAAAEVTATPRVRAVTRFAFTAAPDAVHLVDPSGGNVVCTLPKASVDNAGHFVWIARVATGYDIPLQCAGSVVHGTIPADIGMYRVMSDGGAWWREL